MSDTIGVMGNDFQDYTFAAVTLTQFNCHMHLTTTTGTIVPATGLGFLLAGELPLGTYQPARISSAQISFHDQLPVGNWQVAPITFNLGSDCAGLLVNIWWIQVNSPDSTLRLLWGGNLNPPITVPPGGATIVIGPLDLPILNCSTSPPPPPSTDWFTSQSASSLRNNVTATVGCTFTVGGAPLTVTALSRYTWPGNSGAHLLRLWDYLAGLVIASATVNMAGAVPGSLVSVAVPPTTIYAGGKYALTSDELNAGDQWSDDTLVITTTADASLVASTNTVPPADHAFGHSYGPVSFEYHL